MQMRLCSRCNQWGETAEPCTCTEELIEADQDVADLKQQIAEAEQRAEKAEKELLILREGIEAVRTLIDNSTAVIGLHLNGDAAEWESLQKGGFFESWLADFNDAEVISNRYPQHFEEE